MRAANPQKYERGAFSTMAMGVGLIALRRSMVPVRHQLALLAGIDPAGNRLLLAIAAALRRK